MDLSQDASRLRLRERRSDAFGGDYKSREHNAGDADEGIIQRAEHLVTGHGRDKSMVPHRGHFDAFMTRVVAMTFSNLLHGGLDSQKPDTQMRRSQILRIYSESGPDTPQIVRSRPGYSPDTQK